MFFILAIDFLTDGEYACAIFSEILSIAIFIIFTNLFKKRKQKKAKKKASVCDYIETQIKKWDNGYQPTTSNLETAPRPTSNSNIVRPTKTTNNTYNNCRLDNSQSVYIRCNYCGTIIPFVENGKVNALCEHCGAKL